MPGVSSTALCSAHREGGGEGVSLAAQRHAPCEGCGGAAAPRPDPQRRTPWQALLGRTPTLVTTRSPGAVL